jgi:ankyrin repeat protein
MELMRTFIHNGTNVNSVDNEMYSMLHVACRAFPEHHNFDHVIEYLVEHGAKVNCIDHYGITPLHILSEYGRIDLVRLLVEHGADVNLTREKPTSLHMATENGHLNVVQYLVDHGANVNYRDKDGVSPLHSACRGGYFDIVRFLVEHGADVTYRIAPCVSDRLGDMIC